MIIQTYNREAPTYGILVRSESGRKTLDLHFNKWFMRLGFAANTKNIKKYGFRFMTNVDKLPWSYLLLEWGMAAKHFRFRSK
jgi:hypothetical protein